ncbi:hypothetical protein KY321_01170 [Candidatus Woesearchaeota archaeon]|nr:hypothetical protein [Candidatus Woesearchaeota archaeon]
MISNELIGKLKIFNLNSYESKIWLALLMKGSDSAGSLSELAGVPRSRCYDVLETLEKKGFIMMKVGKPIKYISVSPSEVLERLKQKHKQECQEKINILNNVKESDLMEDLNSLFDSNKTDVKAEELAGLIKSKDNIDSHINYMIKNSTNILLSIDSQRLFYTKDMIKEVIAKNGKYHIKIITDKNISEELLTEVSSFSEVKLVEDVKKFCVSDNNAVMFLDNEESMVSMNSEYSVNMLKDLFEAKWSLI